MAFMLGKNLDFIDSIHFMNTSLKIGQKILRSCYNFTENN